MDSYSSVDQLGDACRGYLLKRASGKKPRERMDRRRFTREATGWMAQLLTIGPFAEGTIRLSTDGTPDRLWQTIGEQPVARLGCGLADPGQLRSLF